LLIGTLLVTMEAVGLDVFLRLGLIALANGLAQRILASRFPPLVGSGRLCGP
jgi:hypothetical protein